MAERLLRRAAVVLAAVLAATACGDADNAVYRGYACYFVFDTTLHPMPCQLTTALGNAGTFMTVATQVKNGVRHIVTTRNYDGATEDVPLTTERERQTRCQLGAAGAVVIGMSAYTGVLLCYEGQCPNCLTDLTGTRYPLAWTAGGQQLACARCSRTYDVNNGIVATGAGGRQLYQYNAAYDGAVLRAWN